MTKGLLFISILLFLSACDQSNPNYQEDAADPEFMHRSMKQLTDVIVHDIFSPPVASRIYAYPSIAAYEIIQQQDPSYRSLAGQLTDFKAPPQPQTGTEICYSLAAIQAFIKTGKALIFSEDKMDAFREEILAEYQAIKMPKKVFDQSIEYGNAVSDHVLAWADKDNYKQTRTFPKYTIPREPSRWKPTPPDYMDGIEPHWREIRPFVIDSAQQFTPPPPTEFDMTEGSKFYDEVIEVYKAVKEQTEEQKEIAEFWDCNPFVSHHKGHVMFATKKITPGGHWINITATAGRMADSDLTETIQAYTLVSIALADAFISCWDEKYRSSLIRPETVINQYMDEDWLPTLQTPPFPEHTSGHSVISSASAVALTSIYGDNFAFVDSTEVEFGLPPRSFKSFIHASEEAAVSRLYGGIHYRPAIDYGVDQGRAIGKFILKEVEMKSGAIGAKE